MKKKVKAAAALLLAAVLVFSAVCLFSACGAVSCQPPEANTPAMLIMTDCNGDRILETAVPFDHETDVLVEDLNALIVKASAKE